MSDTPVLDGKVTINRMLPGGEIVRREEYDKCFDIEAYDRIEVCQHCGHCHECGMETYSCDGDVCEDECTYHKHHLCRKCDKCLGWCCTCPGWIAPHRKEHFELMERERLAAEREAHEARMEELGIKQHTLPI